MDRNFEMHRNSLVGTYIIPSTRNKEVVSAFRRVPRHLFVPPAYQDRAYDDAALPIGYGQTISQPSLVAAMTEALGLDKQKSVLEIGTGSGYQAALLSLLVKTVVTVERIPELAEKARTLLKKLGYTNVMVITGDGKLGYPKCAPYDGILVTAGTVVLPQELLDQLKEGGNIVVPFGKTLHDLELQLGHKTRGEVLWQKKGAVTFVPLI